MYRKGLYMSLYALMLCGCILLCGCAGKDNGGTADVPEDTGPGAQVNEQYVDEIVTVRESSIRTAVKWSAVYAKLVLEGAGALPLAAVLERKIDISQAAVLVCSGGNIDLQVLWEALAEG